MQEETCQDAVAVPSRMKLHVVGAAPHRVEAGVFWASVTDEPQSGAAALASLVQ